MLEHAQEAVDMAAGKSRQELDSNRMLSLALVPWPEIVGLRNRLIHGYEAVDLDIPGNIIQIDLPALVANVQAILDNAKPPGELP